MNWIEEAHTKFQRNNQVLNNHRVMAIWAFDFADETTAKLEEKYPDVLMY